MYFIFQYVIDNAFVSIIEDFHEPLAVLLNPLSFMGKSRF